jgi:predicted DNA binding CopG/RHH family protein
MTEAKKGPGRPPLPEPEDERLEIRLSARRKASYKAAADRKGLPIGTWAKAVLDRASKR